jgi:transcriptional regulator NrdR family protein
MKVTECPKCGSDTMVSDCRESKKGFRRRRVCTSAKCGERFSTLEIMSETYDALKIIADVYIDSTRKRNRLAKYLGIVIEDRHGHG